MKLHRQSQVVTCCFVLCSLVMSTTSANATPAVGLSGGSFLTTGESVNNQSQTIGWGFTVSDLSEITHLGLFDGDQDGLGDPHEIGIWDSLGNLLVSTTIPEGTGTTLDGLFRYTHITPLVVMPGNTYVIGGHYAGIQGGGSIDPDPADRDRHHGPFQNSGFSTRVYAPEINFVDSRSSSQQTTGLQFPFVQGNRPEPYLGPNFQFNVVPEPSIDVDIKPGSFPNSVNLKSKGVLPVAILGTGDFDVNEVDFDTLLFGDPELIINGGTAVSPLRSALEDVSGDGLLDLTLKFSTADLVEYEALGPDTVEGLLTGALFDGTPFEGMDSIRIVPPNGSNGNSLQISAVPEPTTLALTALGLLGIGRRRRKRA